MKGRLLPTDFYNVNLREIEKVVQLKARLWLTFQTASKNGPFLTVWCHCKMSVFYFNYVAKFSKL